jgi:hypothetical protein
VESHETQSKSGQKLHWAKQEGGAALVGGRGRRRGRREGGEGGGGGEGEETYGEKGIWRGRRKG